MPKSKAPKRRPVPVKPKSGVELQVGRFRQAKAVGFRFLGRWVAPQWLRTILAAMVWITFLPIVLAASGNPQQYALVAGACVVLATSAAVHLWPPRTAPWRTIGWLIALTVVPVTLFAGVWETPPRAFVPVLLASMTVFLLLRLNQNGRKIALILSSPPQKPSNPVRKKTRR